MLSNAPNPMGMDISKLLTMLYTAPKSQPSARMVAAELLSPESTPIDIGIKKINLHFDLLRTISMSLYSFEFPRSDSGGQDIDDRFADNMNVIFDCFDLYENPTDNQDKKRGEQFLSLMDELRPFAQFIQITPSENFKLLVYRLNIKSISDLKSLLEHPLWRIDTALAEVPSHVLNFMLCTKEGLTPLEFKELYLSEKGQAIQDFLKEMPVENCHFFFGEGQVHRNK